MPPMNSRPPSARMTGDQRHIRAQVLADSGEHPLAGLADPLAFGHAAARFHACFPEAASCAADGADGHDMAWLEGADLAEDGAWPEHMAEVEEIIDAACV